MADLETVHATIDHTGITGVGGTTPAFVGCRAYHSTTQNISSASDTAVLFNTEDFDTDAIHSTASNTGRFTVPAGMGGKWRFRCNLFVPALTGGGSKQVALFLRKNGTTVLAPNTRYIGDASLSVNMKLDEVVVLVAGDYIEFMINQASGLAVAIGHASVASAQNYGFAQFLGA